VAARSGLPSAQCTTGDHSCFSGWTFRPMQIPSARRQPAMSEVPPRPTPNTTTVRTAPKSRFKMACFMSSVSLRQAGFCICLFSSQKGSVKANPGQRRSSAALLDQWSKRALQTSANPAPAGGERRLPAHALILASRLRRRLLYLRKSAEGKMPRTSSKSLHAHLHRRLVALLRSQQPFAVAMHTHHHAPQEEESSSYLIESGYRL
jgi:hypothetical protein